jgi:hypothetical protein
MSLLVSWLVFPLVFAALSFGCGLLVEVAARVRLPFALLLPVGFALIVCVAQFATMSGTTASLAAPAVVACAVVGAVLAPARLRPRGWPLTAAGVTYAAYAAPTVFSGQTTFAGYIKLDDTATYLAMLDRVMTHGRSLAGLAPSTYEATLATSLAYGYPVGSLVTLGVGHELFGTDAAWLWQPYVAFLGALLALALYALIERLVELRPLRAGVAVVAAQPALLFGYSLWGGIKELSAAALVAAAAALVSTTLGGAARSVVPLAVVAAAIVGVLSVGGLVWVAPLVAVTAILLMVVRGPRFTLITSAAFAVVVLLLSIPPIVAAVAWLPRSRGFTSEAELGNLVGALDWLQVFGIWPVGDFRHTPGDMAPVYVLIVVTAAGAVAGTAWAVVRRRWEIVTYAAAIAIAAFALVLAGSPWVGAKALATAAPAAVVLALSTFAALITTGRRVEGGVLAAAVVGGVLWSNVLAYREVALAPRSRLAELEQIGERFAGEGPALMTEYEPYGARHFLRRLDAEGASELRRHLVALQSGRPLEPQAYADLDRFRLSDLLAYRTFVLRRSPVESFPPSGYEPVFRGHWYEVWQLRSGPRVLKHVPLGNELDPAGVPSCAWVVKLARTRGATQLLGLERAPVAAISFASRAHPPRWPSFGADVYPDSDGTVATSVAVPRTSSYEFWLGGSFVGSFELRVDGQAVAVLRHQLEWAGQYVLLGRVPLMAGQHTVELRYDADGIRPGSHGIAPFPLGPLVVAPEEHARQVEVAPVRARTLCGRRFDWIEAIGSG